MAFNYRPVDRCQLFLVPPDMRDWLPADHLAWFILEVVEVLNTDALHAKSKRGGTGREGYDPDLLLGLWLYASARGISSSRQIERACSEDVAFRVLCVQDVPDHTVLARFRQRHQEAMTDLFAQVLALCVRQGLGRFGMIAIDGTKIRANASKDKTLSVKALRKLAEAELQKAEATDAAEDAANAPAAGDDLPPGMGSGSERRARLKEAIRQVEELVEQENAPIIALHEERVRAAQDRLSKAEAEHQARQAAWEDAARDKRPGKRPVEDPAKLRRRRDGVAYERRQLENAKKKAADHAAGEQVDNRTFARRNSTDPQSRVMKTRDGFIQGYNAQLAVSDDQLILVAELTDRPADAGMLIPMMTAADNAVARCAAGSGRADVTVGTITADNGYLSDQNVEAPGPDRVIAPGRGRIREGEWVSTLKDGREASKAAKIMLKKLKNPENQTLYARRSVTVEPVNGHLKDRRGLRQFARRGLAAANAELQLAAMTTNLMKLFTIWEPATATS